MVLQKWNLPILIRWWLIFDQPSSAYRMRAGGWDEVQVEDYLDGLFAGIPDHAPANPKLPPPGPLPPAPKN